MLCFAGILGMPTGPFLYADQLIDTLQTKANQRYKDAAVSSAHIRKSLHTRKTCSELFSTNQTCRMKYTHAHVNVIATCSYCCHHFSEQHAWLQWVC